MKFKMKWNSKLNEFKWNERNGFRVATCCSVSDTSRSARSALFDGLDGLGGLVEGGGVRGGASGVGGGAGGGASWCRALSSRSSLSLSTRHLWPIEWPSSRFSASLSLAAILPINSLIVSHRTLQQIYVIFMSFLWQNMSLTWQLSDILNCTTVWLIQKKNYFLTCHFHVIYMT